MSALHLTGVDERVELVIGARLVTLFADVIEFDASLDVDEISYKPLGQSGTAYGRDFAGWSGSMTVIDSTPIIEMAITEMTRAMRSRIPLPITIIHTRVPKGGGPPIVHTYTNCQVTPGRQVRREQATQVTFAWTTGHDREVD